MPRTVLIPHAKCLRADCQWRPDPEAHGSVDSQADKHTRTTGHGTLSWATPAPAGNPTGDTTEGHRTP
jgi:hypothetical protein